MSGAGGTRLDMRNVHLARADKQLSWAMLMDRCGVEDRSGETLETQRRGPARGCLRGGWD